MAKKKFEIEELYEFMRENLATKTDLADLAAKADIEAFDKKIDGVEKRLGDRIDGIKVKVEGVQKTLDDQTLRRADLQLPRRVHDLEEDVFGLGRSKHPKHLPL